MFQVPENRIRQLRKEKGLTLKELSHQLKKEGTPLSASSLIKYERGERNPKLETWIKIANFFNVPVSYLQGKQVENHLKEVLDKKNMDLEELSSLIKKAGYSISPEELKEYENGSVIPQFDTWYLISNILGVSFNYLVGISVNKKELQPALAPFIKLSKNDNSIMLDIPESQDDLKSRIKDIRKSLPEDVEFGFKRFNDVWEDIDDMAFKVPSYLKDAVNWYFLEMCLNANYRDQKGERIDLATYNKLESSKMKEGSKLDMPLYNRADKE